MIISKKRIRNIELYWHLIEDNNEFYITVSELDRFTEILKNIGFTENLVLGETILPKPIGSISRNNAEGKNEKQKHLPKETAYRQVEWSWKQFIGGGDYEEITELRDVPYQRYPVVYVEPQCIELSIIEVDNKKMVASTKITKSDENSSVVKHIFNLFFEIFGECMILDENLDIIQIPEIKRLNWKVLPPGEYPFDTIEKYLNSGLSVVKNRNSKVIKHRVNEITNYKPNFVAHGITGFTGYWIFGFPNKNIFVLESVYPNNATYVLGNDWENISKLSKSEILRDDLHLERIVHSNTWKTEIRILLQ
jgi:hypothetical protein